jgi:hypothetical protein
MTTLPKLDKLMLQNQLVMMQALQMLVGRNANLAAQQKLTEQALENEKTKKV